VNRAVAFAFAREGADMLISYLDEHEDAQETARWIVRADTRRRGPAVRQRELTARSGTPPARASED
jgi:hypothetical protein